MTAISMVIVCFINIGKGEYAKGNNAPYYGFENIIT